jgi:hypothetical protein
LYLEILSLPLFVTSAFASRAPALSIGPAHEPAGGCDELLNLQALGGVVTKLVGGGALVSFCPSDTAVYTINISTTACNAMQTKYIET